MGQGPGLVGGRKRYVLEEGSACSLYSIGVSRCGKGAEPASPLTPHLPSLYPGHPENDPQWGPEREAPEVVLSRGVLHAGHPSSMTGL